MLRLWPNTPERYWDMAALQATMQNVMRFQQTYGTTIWAGEFSAIRWAPGSARWLSDAVDLF